MKILVADSVPDRVIEILKADPSWEIVNLPKTKGKVERVNREVQESFLAWLTGQVLSPRPTTADYDAFARQWLAEVVLPRRHRTTKRVIAEAWNEGAAAARGGPGSLDPTLHGRR